MNTGTTPEHAQNGPGGGSKPNNIEVIARALVIRGEWILLCRNMEKGYFYLPGGHVEPGESSAQACERELYEETGLAARVGDCALVAEQRFDQEETYQHGVGTGVAGGEAHRRHEINLVFHVEHLESQSGDGDGGPPPEVRSREPHIGFEWVRLSELAGTDLRPRFMKGWILDGGPEVGLRFMSVGQ